MKSSWLLTCSKQPVGKSRAGPELLKHSFMFSEALVSTNRAHDKGEGQHGLHRQFQTDPVCDRNRFEMEHGKFQ